MPTYSRPIDKLVQNNCTEYDISKFIETSTIFQSEKVKKFSSLLFKFFYYFLKKPNQTKSKHAF